MANNTGKKEFNIPYRIREIPTSFKTLYIFFSPMGIKEIKTESLEEAQRFAYRVEEESKDFLLKEWIHKHNS